MQVLLQDRRRAQAAGAHASAQTPCRAATHALHRQILDCCHAGIVTRSSTKGVASEDKRLRKKKIKTKKLQWRGVHAAKVSSLALSTIGWWAIAATDLDSVAHEVDSGGLFTRHFCEGLEGAPSAGSHAGIPPLTRT